MSAGQGFLPPEPSGQAPDLSEAPTRETPPAPETQQQAQTHGGYAPPPGAQEAQGQGWGTPQSPQAPHRPPQGYWQAQPQQPWGYGAQPAVPDNGSAVAGFSLSLTGGALLLISFGLSSVVSVVCSALGVFYSRRGRQRVDRGETPKHRGLAQAGFIIGLISLVLSVLATLGYGALLVLYFTSEEFQRDFDREFEREFDAQQAIVLCAHAVRGALSLAT